MSEGVPPYIPPSPPADELEPAATRAADNPSLMLHIQMQLAEVLARSEILLADRVEAAKERRDHKQQTNRLIERVGGIEREIAGMKVQLAHIARIEPVVWGHEEARIKQEAAKEGERRLIDRVFTRGRMAWAAIIAAGGAIAAMLNTKPPDWWPGQ